MGVPTGARHVVEVVDYDPAWPVLFGETGRAMRSALGAVALRIDHIGSTAVADLAAKPVIDVQISVAAFEPVEAFKDPLERLGYVYRADNAERTKRYFREAPGRRRTHSTFGVPGASLSSFRCSCGTTCASMTTRRPSSPR
jgi:GrpB-like predicted nucleotidyltransferase (UPF0157 family)